jgi:hypothetical protein
MHVRPEYWVTGTSRQTLLLFYLTSNTFSKTKKNMSNTEHVPLTPLCDIRLPYSAVPTLATISIPNFISSASQASVFYVFLILCRLDLYSILLRERGRILGVMAPLLRPNDTLFCVTTRQLTFQGLKASFVAFFFFFCWVLDFAFFCLRVIFREIKRLIFFSLFILILHFLFLTVVSSSSSFMVIAIGARFAGSFWSRCVDETRCRHTSARVSLREDWHVPPK